MAFIYVTILLDVLGFGLLIPVLPKLVLHFEGGSEAQAAVIFGVLLTVWSLMQFLFSPLLGVLSDRFGRRPVLILSAIGLGLDYIIMALAPTLAWLFVGRVLSGIFASSQPSAAAYVADVTPPERRAAAFGMIGAMWGIGFIVGPAFGGALALVDLRFPFWAAAAMSLASAAYGFFVLPESLAREHRKPFSWGRANPVGSLALLRSHRELLGLGAVNFLAFLAFQVLPSTFVIYADARYGWNELDVGLTLTAVGFSNIVVQGILVKPLVKRLGERKMLYTGLLAATAGFLIYGLAWNGYIVLVGVPVFAFVGLVQPALQSLMTRRVNPRQQGELQGANQSILGLTGIIGPVLFGSVLAAFLNATIRFEAFGTGLSVPLIGAAFFLSASLMLAGAFLGARVTRASAVEPVRGPAIGSHGPTPDPDGKSGPR